jgi:hypothetical protein
LHRLLHDELGFERYGRMAAIPESWDLGLAREAHPE